MSPTANMSDCAGRLTESSVAERRRWLQALANLSIFARASNDSVEILLKESRFYRYRAHELIIDENEPAANVHILLEGKARVFQASPDGIEYTPKIFCAPTHFGDLGALAGLSKNGSSVQALTDSVTAAIPTRVIEEQLSQDHGLCLAWLYSVARQHSVTIDSDRQSVFGGAAARLTNVLLSYADAFAEPLKGMTAIDYPLSYSTLGRQVGCTRRSAIALMKRFQQLNLVKHTADGWLVNIPELRFRLAPGNLSLTHSFSDTRGAGPLR